MTLTDINATATDSRETTFETYRGRLVQNGEPSRQPGGYRHTRVARLTDAIALLNDEAYVAHSSNLPGMYAVLRYLTFELAAEVNGLVPMPKTGGF